MNPLGEARAYLIGLGEDLCQLCRELGLPEIHVTAAIHDGSSVSVDGLNANDDVLLSFSVVIEEASAYGEQV